MRRFLVLPREVLSPEQDGWFPGDRLMAAIYVALVNKANWADANSPLPRQKITLKRGQCSIGTEQFAKEFRIGRQVLRTILGKLQHMRKINQQHNQRDNQGGTLITIIDYDKLYLFRPDGQPAKQPGNQPRTNQGLTTSGQEDKEDKEEDNNNTASPLAVAAEEFLALWNSNRGTLRAAKAMTPTRQLLLADRSAERPDLAYWEGTIKRMAASAFICSKPWGTIDWLLKNDENHVKVAEGNYDAKPSGVLAPVRCTACKGLGEVRIRRGEEKSVAACDKCAGAKIGCWKLADATRSGWEPDAEPKSLKLVTND